MTLMTQQLNDQGLTEEEVERTIKYNALIRKVCMWEIRKGEATERYRKKFHPGKKFEYSGYYEAVMATHAPDGARGIIDRLYGLRRKL
jgi:hypothetical protein